MPVTKAALYPVPGCQPVTLGKLEEQGRPEAGRRWRVILRACRGEAARQRRRAIRSRLYLGGVSDNVNDNYEKLAGLLGSREGWRPEIQDGERHWCFGVAGAARLVITPEMDGFLMYRADRDSSWVIPGSIR
jgi:hypothetical protein